MSAMLRLRRAGAILQVPRQRRIGVGEGGSKINGTPHQGYQRAHPCAIKLRVGSARYLAAKEPAPTMANCGRRARVAEKMGRAAA